MSCSARCRTGSSMKYAASTVWCMTFPASRPRRSSGNEDAPLTYSVKEIFYTLQGEGAQTGRPAVFCRFAGCNLWTGREADRAEAICRFCDTDFVGTDGTLGGKFAHARDLAAIIEA